MLEVGVVEVRAQTAAGAERGELEEVGLDAFELLVGELWEARDDAFDTGVRHGCACCGGGIVHQAAKSAVAMTAPGVPA